MNTYNRNDNRNDQGFKSYLSQLKEISDAAAIATQDAHAAYATQDIDYYEQEWQEDGQ